MILVVPDLSWKMTWKDMINYVGCVAFDTVPFFANCPFFLEESMTT